MVTSDARVRGATHAVCQDVVSRKVQDEVVLLNLQTGIYFSLNDVGAVIWSCLEAGQSPDEAVAALVSEYEVTADVARGDVRAFLSTLHELGLVEIR